MKSIVKITLIGWLIGISPLPSVAAEEVVIGVLAKRGPEKAVEKWSATAHYLSQKIPQYQFRIKPLGFDQMESAVRSEEVDFLLTNSAIYVQLESRYGLNRIATLKNRIGTLSSSIFGGVIFTRTDSVLESIDELKGRRMMAVAPTSLGGFQMAWGEMNAHDLDPYQDLLELQFGGTHDAVVYAVLDGSVEVGTVRTDTLERMENEGKISLAEIKVLMHEPHEPRIQGFVDDLPLLHSTQHYPEWPFAKLVRTPLLLAEEVAKALLEIIPDSEPANRSNSMGWTIPLNYQPVHQLLKMLQLPPYEPKPVGIREFLSQHQLAVGGVLLGFLSLLWIAVVLKRSNRHLLQTRGQLEKSRDELNHILYSMGEGLVVVDGDNRIRRVNKQLVDMVGSSEELLRGQSVSRLFCSTGCEIGHTAPASLLELFGEQLQQVHDHDHEKFHHLLDEAPVPLFVVDITNPGTELRLFLSSRDLAYQLGYKREALNSAALSSLLSGDDLEYITRQMRSIDDGETTNDHHLYHWRGRNGTSLKSTASLYQLFCGEENHVLVGVNIASSFPWPLVNMTPFGRLFSKGEREALDLLSVGGAKIPIQISTTMLQGDDGIVEGAILAIHDLRDFLSAENERRSNRAKDDFFASMSHELRTPLTAIIGNCEMLGRYEKDPEKGVMIRSIEVSGQSQLALVNDILDLSKIESGKFKVDEVPYDLSELLRDIDHMLSTKAENSALTLTCKQMNNEVYQLLGDKQRIGQILINLIGNAIKFTPQGSVSLTTRVEQQQLLFSVRDSGIGMTPEVLRRLFQRFEQADETTSSRFGGSGLGLFISRTLAELMGGTIEVSSREGVGSTFELKLPYKRSDQKVEKSGPLGRAEWSDDAKLSGHVLVAEDTPELQMLERRMLEGMGLTVETASDGEEAVNLVMQSRFDLIFMDMQMPVMDGLEATREIRRQGRKVPIIALTANVMQRHRDAFDEAGCDGFLAKPIDLRALRQMIRQHLKLKADLQNLERLGRTDHRKMERREAPPEDDSRERKEKKQERGDAPRRLQDRVAETIRQLPSDVDECIDDELRQLYQERLAVMYRELEAANRTEAWDQFCMLAHTIKGSAASFGHPQLTGHGKAFCDAMDQERMEQVSELATTLMRAVEKALP